MPIVPTKILPVGEWIPDKPDFGNPGITVARNVVALSKESYGPIPSLQTIGFTALPEQPVLGLFTFVDSQEVEHIFAGTASHLWHLAAGSTEFTDVSRLDADGNQIVYNASITNQWVMCSFGPSIIATNGVDPPQTFLPGEDENFSNLADPTPAEPATVDTAYVPAKNGAPVGRCVATVRNWLMFGNINDNGTILPTTVIWSAIGDPSYYPLRGTLEAAIVQSDFNELPSGLGQIRGIATGLQAADAGIICDNGVVSVTHTGSPTTFGFTLAQNAAGCRVPTSIVVNRGICFYLGQDGFYQFSGIQGQAIGAQRIDRWFFNDEEDGVDPSYITLVQGAVDTSERLILWLYPNRGSNGALTRMLIYSWVLDRWTMARISAQWASKGISMGYTLDQLDPFGTVDTISPNFDSPFWKGGAPQLYVIDASGNVSTFTGDTMAARVDTVELQLTPGGRTRITNSRPLVDGGSALVSIGTRNRLVEDVVWTPLVPQNYHGECPQRVDSRYARARIDIPTPAFIFEFVCTTDEYDAIVNAGAFAPTGTDAVADATDTTDAVFVTSATGLVELSSVDGSQDQVVGNAIFGFIPPLAIVETASALDSFIGNLGNSELAPATDSSDATITRGGSVAETASPTDSSSTSMGRAGSTTETGTASDAVGGGRVYATSITETTTTTDAPDATTASELTMSVPSGYTSGDLIGEDTFTSASLDTDKWAPWQGWHASTRIEGGALPSPYSGSHIFANTVTGGFKINCTASSTSATLTWTAGVNNGLTNGDEYFINDRNSFITPTCLFTYTGTTNSNSGSQAITLAYAATGSVTNRNVTISHTDQTTESILPTYKDPYPYAPAASPVGWSPLESWSGLSNTSPGDLSGGAHLVGGSGVLQINTCATSSTTFQGLGWSTVGGAISSRTGGTLILPVTGGLVQVRAKMPDMRYGIWPEIWIMPDTGSFGADDSKEIDLFEGGYTGAGTPNTCVAQNFHAASSVTPSGNFTETHGTTQVFSDAAVDLTADYHIYAAEIIPGTSVKTYFDGVLTATWTTNVPTGTRYALILDCGFASPTASGFRTVYDPAHPGPYNFYVNDVQFYGL